MDIFHSVVLGIVEGVSEFLPISSTGHLILSAKLMGLEQTDFLKTFEVAIQLGSILAVVVMYFKKLLHNRSLWVKLIVGFIPTGILGLTLYKIVKDLFSPNIVAYMLIAGGIVFLWIEKFYHQEKYHFQRVEEVSYKQAFLIGLFQSLAMIPGTSRSGSTIIGGLLLGLSRKCAAEFSFLLAIPTIFAATFYDIYKNYPLFKSAEMEYILVGGVVAFLTSLLVIKIFMKFISRFTYVGFGIYRILIGVIFLFWVL